MKRKKCLTNLYEIYWLSIISVTDSENTMPKHLSPDVISALKGVRFIAQHIKDADRDNEVNSSSNIFVFIFFFYGFSHNIIIICQVS